LLRVIKERTTHLCCVMFTLHVAVCCMFVYLVCACWGKAYKVPRQSFHSAPPKAAGKIKKNLQYLASHSWYDLYPIPYTLYPIPLSPFTLMAVEHESEIPFIRLYCCCSSGVAVKHLLLSMKLFIKSWNFTKLCKICFCGSYFPRSRKILVHNKWNTDEKCVIF